MKINDSGTNDHDTSIIIEKKAVSSDRTNSMLKKYLKGTQ